MVLETGKFWKARKFYEKLRFKVSAILKENYGGVDFVVMEKLMKQKVILTDIKSPRVACIPFFVVNQTIELSQVELCPFCI